jgi:hypothetical protein
LISKTILFVIRLNKNKELGIKKALHLCRALFTNVFFFTPSFVPSLTPS